MKVILMSDEFEAVSVTQKGCGGCLWIIFWFVLTAGCGGLIYFGGF